MARGDWIIIRHKTADPAVRYYIREQGVVPEDTEVEIRTVRNAFYDTEDFTPEHAARSGTMPAGALFDLYEIEGAA